VREPWYDEYYSLVEASTDLATLREGDQPPVYFFLLALFRAQYSVWGARVFSLVVSLLFLALVLLFLRKFGNRAALLTGLVAATTPMLMRYGVEIRAYGLLVLLSLIVAQLTDILRRKPDSPVLFVALLLTLITAAWTHAVGIFLAPAAVGVWILGSERSKPQYFRWASLLFVPLMATGTWLLYYRLDKKHRYGWIPELSWDHFWGEIFEAVTGDVLESQVLYGQAAKSLVWLSLAAFFLALGLAAWKGREGRLYLWGVALYLSQMVFVCVVYEGIMLGRTVLPVYGFFLFFLAASFESIRGHKTRSAVTCLLILFSGVSVCRWVGWDARASKEHWNRPLALLKEELSDSDILLTDSRIYPIPTYRFPELQGRVEFYGGPGDVQADQFDATRTVYVLVYGDSEAKPFQELYQRLAHSRTGKRLYKESLCTIWRFEPVAEP
ncbi:MAG: glycosyltransferase family 39 protein, partial [Candidatus Eremiobacteraeota bacterium]|nr:glycosyltransferase family 39 protein [Candidatus Eremiobacteraeota bacterium]